MTTILTLIALAFLLLAAVFVWMNRGKSGTYYRCPGHSPEHGEHHWHSSGLLNVAKPRGKVEEKICKHCESILKWKARE